eukprot:jgi/Botrbrau1/5178/Bobra.0172s0049.1
MIQTYAQLKAALETYGKSRRQMPRMAEPENVFEGLRTASGPRSYTASPRS